MCPAGCSDTVVPPSGTRAPLLDRCQVAVPRPNAVAPITRSGDVRECSGRCRGVDGRRDHV